MTKKISLVIFIGFIWTSTLCKEEMKKAIVISSIKKIATPVNASDLNGAAQSNSPSVVYPSHGPPPPVRDLYPLPHQHQFHDINHSGIPPERLHVIQNSHDSRKPYQFNFKPDDSLEEEPRYIIFQQPKSPSFNENSNDIHYELPINTDRHPLPPTSFSGSHPSSEGNYISGAHSPLIPASRNYPRPPPYDFNHYPGLPPPPGLRYLGEPPSSVYYGPSPNSMYSGPPSPPSSRYPGPPQLPPPSSRYPDSPQPPPPSSRYPGPPQSPPPSSRYPSPPQLPPSSLRYPEPPPQSNSEYSDSPPLPPTISVHLGSPPSPSSRYPGPHSPSGSRHPGSPSPPDPHYPGPTSPSGSGHPGSHLSPGSRYPSSPPSPSSRYPVPPPGSEYPGPHSSSGSRYPGSSSSSEHPGPHSSSGSRYPGSSSVSGYPGSSLSSSSRYPGQPSPSGSGYISSPPSTSSRHRGPTPSRHRHFDSTPPANSRHPGPQHHSVVGYSGPPLLSPPPNSEESNPGPSPPSESRYPISEHSNSRPPDSSFDGPPPSGHSFDDSSLYSNSGIRDLSSPPISSYSGPSSHSSVSYSGPPPHSSSSFREPSSPSSNTISKPTSYSISGLSDPQSPIINRHRELSPHHPSHSSGKLPTGDYRYVSPPSQSSATPNSYPKPQTELASPPLNPSSAITPLRPLPPPSYHRSPVSLRGPPNYRPQFRVPQGPPPIRHPYPELRPMRPHSISVASPLYIRLPPSSFSGSSQPSSGSTIRGEQVRSTYPRKEGRNYPPPNLPPSDDHSRAPLSTSSYSNYPSPANRHHSGSSSTSLSGETGLPNHSDYPTTSISHRRPFHFTQNDAKSVDDLPRKTEKAVTKPFNPLRDRKPSLDYPRNYHPVDDSSEAHSSHYTKDDYDTERRPRAPSSADLPHSKRYHPLTTPRNIPYTSSEESHEDDSNEDISNFRKPHGRARSNPPSPMSYRPHPPSSNYNTNSGRHSPVRQHTGSTPGRNSYSDHRDHSYDVPSRPSGNYRGSFHSSNSPEIHSSSKYNSDSSEESDYRPHPPRPLPTYVSDSPSRPSYTSDSLSRPLHNSDQPPPPRSHKPVYKPPITPPNISSGPPPSLKHHSEISNQRYGPEPPLLQSKYHSESLPPKPTSHGLRGSSVHPPLSSSGYNHSPSHERHTSNTRIQPLSQSTKPYVTNDFRPGPEKGLTSHSPKPPHEPKSPIPPKEPIFRSVSDSANKRGRHEFEEEDYDHSADETLGSTAAIPGKPGKDYPILSQKPQSDFNCRSKHPGYYADMENRCQVYYLCGPQGHLQSFLCPNGTIFNQATFVCEWWFNVDCDDSEKFYSKNNDLYKIPSPDSKNLDDQDRSQPFERPLSHSSRPRPPTGSSSSSLPPREHRDHHGSEPFEGNHHEPPYRSHYGPRSPGYSDAPSSITRPSSYGNTYRPEENGENNSFFNSGEDLESYQQESFQSAKTIEPASAKIKDPGTRNTTISD